MATRGPLCLLACDDARASAELVARQLGAALTPSRDMWFACGEGKFVIDANVRGHDVYLFQHVVPSDGRTVYDRFIMLLHAVDAARLADAERITVVLPYLPGARQDKRKGHLREGVSTGLFARMLQEAGADMVITVEPHNEAIVGCFDPRRCVFESLLLDRSLARHLREAGVHVDVVASTDVGGLEMARRLAERMQAGIVALSKERDYAQVNTVRRAQVIGEVKGQRVLIVDDIVDTAGSVVAAAHALWDEGALDITVAGVHCVCSGPAWERLQGLADESARRGLSFAVVGTSSVTHADPPPWYRSMSLEPILAQVIHNVNCGDSVRRLESHP